MFIVIDEFLNFTVTSGILASAAGRALGAIFSKHKQLGGVGYNAYRAMYNACVVPNLDYASGIWGFGAHDKIDTVQNRAIRLFLGVHGYAANAAINGDIGWTSCRVRRKVEMLRMWNRLRQDTMVC